MKTKAQKIKNNEQKKKRYVEDSKFRVEIKLKNKQYYLRYHTDPNHIENKREYYLKNKVVKLAYAKKRYPKIRDKKLADQKKRRIKDPEYRKIRNAQINASWKNRRKDDVYRKKCNELRKKIRANRRNLGFEPINDWFINCEGHHIDIKNVIYIPYELHRSIPHILKEKDSMIEINRAAFEYLTNDMKWIGE